MPRSFDSVFYGAAGTDAGGASDDEFNRVSFMSHFDGANNGVNNAFDDGSASNHTITANGNVTQGSFGPFARPDGEFAVHFDGEGFYNCAADADFAFGTGDFCMEAWVFVEADDYNYSRIFNFGPYYNNNDSNGLTVDHTDNAHKTRYYDYRNNFFLTSSAATPRNTWFHVAVTKSSNTVRLFINGTAEDSGTNSNAPEASSTNTVSIGNAPDAGTDQEDFQGFISNARVVKGSAVYTSNFTPPTAPLTAITNTKLLTCQSNRFVDNSAEAHAITIGGAAGTIQVSAFGPFLTSSVYDAAVNGASGYFDGNGDYLTAGDSTDYEFGAGDFTIEAWVYASSVDNPAIVSKFPNGARQFSLELSRDNNNHARYRALIYIGEGGVFSNEYIAFNAWNHIAIVGTASDTTARIYTNGIRNSNTISYSGGVPAGGTDPLRVGSRNSGGSFYYEGYICDLRLLKGTAVYSGASFTLPTAPLTAITNTKLLLNMADGQAIDSTAQRNLSLKNGTNISTAQAKFGDSSLYFDGTTDKATVIGSENVNFGAANFTVEGWIRPASFSGYKPTIIAKWNNGSRGWAVRLAASGSGFKMRFTFSTDGSNDYNLDATTVLAFDTWHYFAFVQNSNTVTCYSNGTANGTISCSTIFASTNPIKLGDWDTNQADYNGYIDDIRVTTGVARYTSNFTAPTAAFPDKGQNA